MSRRRVAVVVGVLTSVGTGCGATGLAELEPGRLSPAVVADAPEPRTDEVWMIGLELADRAVEGRRRVLVELGDSAVVCGDGSEAGVASVAVGDEVQVERADQREVRRAVPPIITGRRLVVDCR